MPRYRARTASRSSTASTSRSPARSTRRAPGPSSRTRSSSTGWMSSSQACTSTPRRRSTRAGCPVAWRPLVETRSQAREPIQFALAGMAAHINHDLPIAVFSTSEEFGLAGRRRQRDPPRLPARRWPARDRRDTGRPLVRHRADRRYRGRDAAEDRRGDRDVVARRGPRRRVGSREDPLGIASRRTASGGVPGRPCPHDRACGAGHARLESRQLML